MQKCCVRVQHGCPGSRVAARRLNELLDSGESVRLPAPTIWAFLRISTNARIWTNPLTTEQAFSFIEQWLAQPGVVVVHPGPRHFELLRQLVSEFDAHGILVSDAVLAALALELGATLASNDQDFRRFPSIRWTNPLKPQL